MDFFLFFIISLLQQIVATWARAEETFGANQFLYK